MKATFLPGSAFLPQAARDNIGEDSAVTLGEDAAGTVGEDRTVTLDHIGIAVRDIATARVFYDALGLKAGGVEEIAHEGVRVAMLALGSTRIELLEPLGADSVIGRFLERRGEGMHHIAVKVEDIEARFSKLKADGVRLASDEIRCGAGGHQYFFVHPASTGGVLVEIVGETPAGSGSLR